MRSGDGSWKCRHGAANKLRRIVNCTARDQENSALKWAAIAMGSAILLLGAAQPKDGPYTTEEAARTCVHKRLTELVAQEHRDINGDPALAACTTALKSELKKNGKSDCEAIAYSGWLVANENSKLSGLAGQPYTPNRAFLKHCESANKVPKTAGERQR